MCGICGVMTADPRQIEPAVRAMMRAMVHRGPDDEGYEQLPLGGERGGSSSSATLGFGFRRLAILDLSLAGRQPMLNPATGNCLIFNGEIYNFRELRKELEARGVAFQSTGDTEVLLHALSTWGEAALDKLEGMFALAFYEAKSRRILLARDPLGIKPLYVAALPDRFVFASEIRAVLASGLVPADLDVAGVAGMLAYGAVQSPRTIYERIRSFPAGASQWIDAGVTSGRIPSKPRRYWSFAKNQRPDELTVAAQRVRQLLHSAVLKHLVADVPVGVFLSAGIDSTVIASFAREYTPQVTAFTVGFGRVHGEDEVALSAATAKALGIKHVAVELDAANMPAKWHDWLASMDSPSVDGFNTYVVSKRLAMEGVIVGLSGLGADELFGGYQTFSRGPGWSRLLQTLSFMPAWLRSGAVAGIGQFNGRVGAIEKLRDLVAGDPSVAGITRSLRRALPNQWLAAMGLAPHQVGLAADYLDRGSMRHDPEFDGDPFNTVSRIESAHYMRDTLLRDTDANSMRHSLEIRVPFLDLPLFSYVSALPGHVKRSARGPTKLLLREAAASVLSHEIANRPKTGFTLPIGDWMRGPMRESCEESIRSVAELPFIEGDEVRRLWLSFLKDERAIHWSRPLALVVLGNAVQYAVSPSGDSARCAALPG
jgi:asparagine synthase (glutamine-hydrolysing)